MIQRGTFRSAAYLILQRGDEILMLQRQNTGYQDGNYSFIAGHIELFESATAAVRREALEEAGIVVAPANLEFVHIVHRHSEDNLLYFDLFFRTTTWTGAIQNMEPEKCCELRWFSWQDLPPNTIPYIRAVVEQVFVKRAPFSEYGWRGI